MKKKRLNFKPFKDMDKLITILVTERGLGKTFRLKREAIDNFLNNGMKFVYLRRRKPEHKLIGQFFDDIRYLYPDHKLEVRGWKFFIDGKECGQALVLVRAQDYKSAPFPEYNMIIFDEFIRKKVAGVGYLDGEVDEFMSLCDSVFRDRPEKQYIYLLANSISVVNPYFIEYRIDVNPYQKYQKSYIEEMNQFMVCYVQHKDFNKDKKEEEKIIEQQTEFRQFTNLLSYGKMANNNEFSEDDLTFIEKKTKQSVLKFQITIDGVNFGCWNDKRSSILYISEKSSSTVRSKYCFEAKDKKENITLLKKYSDVYHTNTLVNKFKQDLLRFENSHVKSVFIDSFAKLGIF